jgi:hypothetical protein
MRNAAPNRPWAVDQTRPEAIDQLIQRNAIGQIAIDEFNVVHAYIP